MNCFFLGVLSSLFASVIFYLLRFHLGFIVNLLFYKVYPNVSGEYRAFQYVYRDKNKSTALNKDNHQSNHDNIQEEDIPKNSKSLLSTKASNQELLEWLKSRAKNERIVKFRIKQFANRLKGEIYIINNGKIKITEKLKGRLTASRIMILTSETILENHHNFGTYLFNVTNNSKLIKGTRSALCIECGNATSGIYCLLEKE